MMRVRCITAKEDQSQYMKTIIDSIIRNAEFEDVHAIFTLIKEHPRELLPRAISDIVQNIDRFLVCEARGQIIGTAAWQILPEMGKTLSPSVEIKSVSISRHYQRKGIGSKLVKAVIRRIKKFNPAQIVVLTFTPKYFRQFGFGEVAKETLMHKLYMGCINCTKYDSPFTCPEVAMTLAVNKKKRRM